VTKRLDLLLIALLVAGLGFGAFQLGRLVEHESEDAALMSSEGAQSTTTASNDGTGPDEGDDRRRLMVLAGLGVLAVIGLIVSLSAIDAVRRSRRRDRWRLR
jgi:hypothetical protein